MDIFQHMWLMGEIPHDLGWAVLVLVPKGTTDTQGIVLEIWLRLSQTKKKLSLTWTQEEK